jgi:hypothetical protein
MRGTAAPVDVPAQPMRNAENGVKQRRNDATPRGVLHVNYISIAVKDRGMWGEPRVSIALRSVSLRCSSSRLEIESLELLSGELNL